MKNLEIIFLKWLEMVIATEFEIELGPNQQGTLPDSYVLDTYLPPILRRWLLLVVWPSLLAVAIEPVCWAIQESETSSCCVFCITLSLLDIL